MQGIGEAKVAQIKAVHALAEEYLKEKMKTVSKVRNSKEVFGYLYLTMRDLKTEKIKVIYLDSAGQIIYENLYRFEKEITRRITSNTSLSNPGEMWR